MDALGSRAYQDDTLGPGPTRMDALGSQTYQDDTLGPGPTCTDALVSRAYHGRYAWPGTVVLCCAMLLLNATAFIYYHVYSIVSITILSFTYEFNLAII
ncbi:hypothetical protein SPTER_43350 [Sporomusa termitida]|uniref:Uncharacterized protein n=1 Tax=Sporomusa termitida TaxID=2377 RepID=A0A517DZX1_9FIRM|nr:hypothetical protein SPTER_43350 [Sporomusa termitida]